MIEIIRLAVAGTAFFISLIFGTAGIIGLFRNSDPYSQLQTGSLCGTTAVFSLLLGALVLSTSWGMAARIVIIGLFFLISSPTGTHIVARFIWASGEIPEKRSPDSSEAGS